MTIYSLANLSASSYYYYHILLSECWLMAQNRVNKNSSYRVLLVRVVKQPMMLSKTYMYHSILPHRQSVLSHLKQNKPKGILGFWIKESSLSKIGMFCNQTLFLYTVQSTWRELIFVVLSKSPVTTQDWCFCYSHLVSVIHIT